jgi:hypothetical protein
MKVTIEVPEFLGFEFVGYKAPEQGECWLTKGELVESVGQTNKQLTYRKIVKYREPTQSDVGKMVEVRDSHGGTWCTSKLLLVIESEYRFVALNGKFWRHARIIDDGTPVKVPREIWVNMYPHGVGACGANREYAAELCAPSVHFREVLP